MAKKKLFNSPYIDYEEIENVTVFYTENGNFSVTLKIENSILAYSADENEYYKFHNFYTALIKILGKNYIIQKHDIFINKEFEKEKSDDFLTNQFFNHFKGRKYIDLETYLTISYNISKKSGIFNFDEKIFETFLKNIIKVIDLFKTENLMCKVLNFKQLENLWAKYYAMDFKNKTFSVDNIKADNEYLIFSQDKFVKSLALVDIDVINLPPLIKPFKNVNVGHVMPVDLFSFLNEIKLCDIIIYHQVFLIPEQRAELNKLEAKQKRHSGVPDPANSLAVNDIEDVLTDVAKKGSVLVHTHFNIMLVTSDEKELNKAINSVESSLFNIASIMPSKQSYNQFELFYCSLPGNAHNLKKYDKFITTSDAAICLLNKERPIKNEKSDFVIHFTDRQGVPVAIDISDMPVETGRCVNRNKFVLGPSGSGKSFLVNHLNRGYNVNKSDVVIVDTGHSYSGLCEYVGGRYVTYEEDNPITMNPFRITTSEYNEEKREFLKSLISLLWKGANGSISQIEDRLISQVINNYYSDYFNSTKTSSYLSFNSFFEYSLKEIKNIVEKKKIPFDIDEYKYIMERFYKGGEFEKILNNELDASFFDEEFIVFEIDAIKEHKVLFPIITLIIMDVFIQKMRLKKNRKVLIIEEAWKAIASPLMANYILYLYKTVRKFYGEAMLVTQELDDILGNEIIKNSVINNSDTIILLDQRKFRDHYEEISNLLSLNEVEQKKIFTINELNNKDNRSRFKEFYIRRGGTGEVYGTEVSLFEYLVYTTERTEKEAIQIYSKFHTKIDDALTAFVNDFKKSGKSLTSFSKSILKTQKPFNYE